MIIILTFSLEKYCYGFSMGPFRRVGSSEKLNYVFYDKKIVNLPELIVTLNLVQAPRFKNFFFCSTQVSMKFFLLINV